MVSSLHRLSLNPFRQNKLVSNNTSIITNNKTNIQNNTNNNHYNDACLWRCVNNHSHRVHIIHGPLAKILAHYPNDYCLTYLGDEQESLTFKKAL